MHLTETCAAGHPRLITHVDTTEAAVHEARRIGPIHDALAEKDLAPQVHLADAAYVSADAALAARDRYGINLVGPLIPNASWQSRSPGGIGPDAFDIDWDQETATCPAGATSESWSSSVERGREQIRVRFSKADCEGCVLRPQCTRGKKYGRQLTLRPERQHEVMQHLRTLAKSSLYSIRQGIEGTISQAVRTCGLRRSRYRGLAKTRLGAWLTGAALNLARIADWLTDRPVSTTRTAPFLRLLSE